MGHTKKKYLKNICSMKEQELIELIKQRRYFLKQNAKCLLEINWNFEENIYFCIQKIKYFSETILDFSGWSQTFQKQFS